MTSTIDPRQLDLLYKPFPAFTDWTNCAIKEDRLRQHTAMLKEARQNATPEIMGKALEIVRRAAAVDTGAIEGLYTVDRGFTLTIAMQAATWQAALETKGGKVRSIIESQLQVYDSILDMATQNTPVIEAWIRALHEQLCRAQETYTVYTSSGSQEHILPLGQYKQMPNHVLRRDGTTHSYAPVDMTPHEMQRLLSELNTPEFLAADYVLQASYAHYAFVCIHPFADGNGRVARALASVYSYRALSVPYMLLLQDKPQYLDALEAADAGKYQSFVDFTIERVIDAIDLASESINAAIAPQPENIKNRIRDLFITKGGLTHRLVDEAAGKLFSAFTNEISRRAQESQIPNMLSINFSPSNTSGRKAIRPGYRTELWGQGGPVVQIDFRTEPPVQAAVSQHFYMEVPLDAGPDDEVFIRNGSNTNEFFPARMSDIWPNLRDAVHLRLSIFVEKIFGEALGEVHAQAAARLRGQ